MSVVGWLTLAGAALLAWVALPSLAPSWRLCASIAFTTLVAIVMLHPPETVVAEPEVAPERGVPAARAAERPRPQRPPAKAAPAPEAPAPEAPPEAPAPEAPPEAPAPEAAAPAAPRPAADPCVALAGLKKEQCKACGGDEPLLQRQDGKGSGLP